MSRLGILVIIQLLIVLPAGASACRSNDWQPTFVHDLVNPDPVPYYVMADGTFVELTGDWTNQSGPGMCCLYGVRDPGGFTNCFEYTRIQCGCDLDSLVNDTCADFLAFKGVIVGGGASSPEGSWSTSFGVMTLGAVSSGRIQGNYATDNGRILGGVTGRVLEGHWVEDGSDERCSSQRDGSYYWGRLRYEFSADWSTFSGGWSYCEATPGSSNWSGTRQ